MKLYYKENGYARVILDSGEEVSLVVWCKMEKPELSGKKYYNKIKSTLGGGTDLLGAVAKVKARGDTSVVFRGVTYTSRRHACKEMDVGDTTPNYYEKLNGMTFQEALEAAIASKADKPIYKGEVYPSVAELCRVLGLSDDRIRQRMAIGMTLEEAVEVPAVDYNITINNITYENVSAACKAFGISVSTYHKRLQAGWTKVKALSTPKEHIGRRVLLTDSSGASVEFDSINESIRVLGASSDRLLLEGWSIDEVIKHKGQITRVAKHHKVNSAKLNKYLKFTKNLSMAVKMCNHHQHRNSVRVGFKNKTLRDRAHKACFKPRNTACMPRGISSSRRVLMIDVYHEAKVLNEGLESPVWSVDHIVPISHALVSGLHVPENLCILKLEDNIEKSNSFCVD